jgi:hypothetical protein
MQHEHTHAPQGNTPKPLTLRTGLRAGSMGDVVPAPDTHLRLGMEPYNLTPRGFGDNRMAEIYGPLYVNDPTTLA